MAAPDRSASASEIIIACAFDDSWTPHFATCATSIAASRRGERVHFILVGGPTLTARSTRAVGDYVRDLGLSWELLTPSEEALRSLPTGGIFSPLVWYRTLLPALLPEHDRVLSLDVDTLVLENLGPLFARDLGDNLLAAVSAAPGPSPFFREPFAGLPPLSYCFNAGVMMLNLEAMRESEIGPRAIALGHEKGERLVFAEQDALNHLARDRWEMLHPKWNALSYLWMAPEFADDAYTDLERATARTSPAVIHFEGGPMIKPWYFRCSHPLRELYRSYRAQTPWPLERLEDVSLAGAVLRKMPFTWQAAISRYKTAVVRGLARR
jgi:lipopolysaccharide biosynthesis glycosyltransferase